MDGAVQDGAMPQVYLFSLFCNSTCNPSPEAGVYMSRTGELQHQCRAKGVVRAVALAAAQRVPQPVAACRWLPQPRTDASP